MRSPYRRFLDKVVAVQRHPEMTPCLEWTGGVRSSRDGYGVFQDGGSWLAHRWVYCHLFGDTELEVHHECENKRCVNPFHLEALTRLDHRKEHASEVCVNGHPFDSRAGNQRTCRMCRNAANQRYKDRSRGDRPKQRRLTASEIQEIRQARLSGEMVKDIAARFGVSRVTVRHHAPA